MNPINIIDLITLVATIFSLVLLSIFWKNNFSLYSKIIMMVLISLNIFHSLSNFLEWANITNLLDPYEDFIQVLEPILWFTLFFAFLQEISEKKLRKSEKKYREAFNRVEFYKDLFAHDINNILQNILSSAELCALYQNKHDNSEKMKEIFGVIKEQVIRGSNLVSNIRRLSDLEESELIVKPIDIYSVIKNLIEFIKNQFPEKNINIQVDNTEKEVFVLANRYLVDAFENIFDNSIRHNKNPTIEILIRISRIKKEGINYVKSEFLDNGIGIEDIRKDSIFQRDRKKDKAFFGQGLGLSLVKKIIDMYNGQIWVEDKVPGEYSIGSNFIIIIPEALLPE